MTNSPVLAVFTVETMAPVFADSTRTLPGVALHLPVVAPVRDQISSVPRTEMVSW